MRNRLFYRGIILAGITLLLATPTFSQATDETKTPVLQGGVVEVNTALNDLRDARLSVNRVRKAAANLYDEVNRQQVTMNYNPNVIGSAVIMTPSPSFGGPLLPPRAKWVKEAMSEMDPILKLFKEDVDQAIESDRRADVSEAAKKQLDPLRQQAFAIVDNSFELYKQLQPLTAGPNYDNGSISALAKRINENMKDLDKALKKGISVLQKDAKANKKKNA